MPATRWCRSPAASRTGRIQALHAVEVDLTDAKATKQAAADLARQFAIGTVVHNAGIIRPNLLPDVQQEDLHDLAQLHLGAAILARAGGAAGHARAEVRPHRADFVARGARPADPHRLFGDQGRHDRHGAHLGARACAVRHHRERGGARADRGHRNVPARWFPPAASAPPRWPRRYRWAGSGAATTWPAP